jgi:hypothetical protein
MTHDQMTLFAAPAAHAESPLARRKPARRPARARVSATDEGAMLLALPLPPPMIEPIGADADRAAAAVCFAPLPLNIPVCPPSTPPLEATSPMPEATDSQPPTHSQPATPAIDDAPATRTDRLWQLDGWTARVIKNQEDDGWAVEMLKDGEAEPALVGPWTMGRDKKNPKPLDQAAFNTLVKTATEVLQRHAQQARAMLHKSLTVFALDAQWEVRLDITPDEYEPFAILSALDEASEEVAQVRVAPDFRLNTASATAWIVSGFARPGGKAAFDY